MATSDKRATAALDAFEIEVPSWGFADTGTRFGKFPQAAAAFTTAEKFEDAGTVHQLTGCCPKVAVHVLWDFDTDAPAPDAAAQASDLAKSHGVQIGSINPNIFQDAIYKTGSFCSHDPAARKAAMDHTLHSILLMQHAGSDALSMWLADGTNYPGQDNLRTRKQRLQDAFAQIHDAMPDGSRLLIEYKPFEPAFYHTDIADWGMADAFCRRAGDKAKVLVDTGHHLPGCNVEHIVAFLLDEGRLGGFHFNDRKYADDDLTIGSIDPYAVFRIFNAIEQHGHDTGSRPDIAYTIDQSHNVKPKLEATVQTVCEAQKQVAKAALVERDELAACQQSGDIVGAELCLKRAFEADVTPVLKAWREARRLPADPLAELRKSSVIADLGARRGLGRGGASGYA
ncbi:MAG: TIM barrel protein [Planctomycetota bacterium]